MWTLKTGLTGLIWSVFLYQTILNILKTAPAKLKHYRKCEYRFLCGVFFPVQGDSARTSITLDFGDGHALTYSNVSAIEDGIKHIYRAVGIYRVTAIGENNFGSEIATLYLHVTSKLLRF